jgi:hypothetical protein
MADDFAAATAEVGDTSVQRREREATRGGTRDERVKAPSAAVNLDDVAALDAL